MARSTIPIAAVFLATAAACGGATEPAGVDEGARGEARAALEVGEHYVVRRDLRKCASPWCGGYLVRAVNRAVTRCADGQVRPECYAAVADYSELRLDPPAEAAFEQALLTDQAIARATLHAGAGPGLYGLGMLYVREGWRAATRAAPTGTFFRVLGVDRQCHGLQTACVTAIETELNGSSRGFVAGVDLTGAGASSRATGAALLELRRTGLLVAGRNVVLPAPFPVRARVELVASQFYTRVQPRVGTISCAGFVGRPCPSWLACDLAIAGACHGADVPGVCKAVPEACLDVEQPVCGCDGATYSNDCFRRMAGAQLDHAGACTPAG